MTAPYSTHVIPAKESPAASRLTHKNTHAAIHQRNLALVLP